ncbi:MAG: nitroreductase family protein [Prevotellaceae bacterium]|jgi:nitroreductase|nr:nitroreductase family protein [Prevotellaceae bacterium]
MKKFNIYQISTLVLGAAFIVLAYTKTSSEKEAMGTSKKEAVIENIHSRKSVRKYVVDRPVSKEDLRTLVKAGMAAPSAKNVQPWAFVALSERATLDRLADELPYAKMLKSAPSAIVVCGRLDKDASGDFWPLDCSAATQNILLAAEAMGLGAVWTAAYPYKDRMEAVVAAVDLPPHIVPLCVIPVGYPGGNETPKDKWKEENLKWEKWD